ncbi:MAG TPA: hypothetical protein VM123_19465 [archaeon]|nr:hypothetical protein [archaeon]
MHQIKIIVILSWLTFLTSPLGAQFDVATVSLDPERMIGYLNSEGERVSREAWERIDSREKLEKQRERLHREFMFMIGLEPLPPRTPLQATVVRTVDCEGYTIEVLHYQSLPGFYVTANLYKPKNGSGPFPAVIWGPGHSTDNVYGSKILRQKHALTWCRDGYICMVVDPIQVAEIFAVHRGVSARQLYDWYARGYTPIGIEVWNAMRGVDYLLTRSDVDREKLTITGVSGGGHLSWMAGAADSRLAVVQPAAGTSDIESHVKLNLQHMHCDCAYFINTYRHDWPTLAALIAPRALLMHNSTGDSYYPPVGYKKVLERAREIYSWFGLADRVDMFEVSGPHAYTKEQREKAVEWSDRCLFGKKSAVEEKPFKEVPGQQLAALGGIYAEHPPNINPRIQELLIPTARLEAYDNLQEWERKRAEVLDKLRNVVFRNLPAAPRAVKKMEGEHDSYALETEAGILVGMVSYIPESMGPKQPAMLYIASEGDTWESSMWEFMQNYPFPGLATSRHMVYPRGIGRQNWDYPLKQRFLRTAMLLGRTLDDMRLYDILCAVDYIASLPSFDPTGFTVVGKGAEGILGAYAALLDPRITRVILYAPPLSHKQGPIFLNVLRYTDIPQALAMLAPRELVFLTDDMDYFDYARKVYKLYGAESRFRRCYTVAQALNLKE